MLRVTNTPADFEALAKTDLSETTCIVLDILRATSSMVAALANGADGILPVATIEEALAAKEARPDALLAGEREGYRITAAQSGGTDFDLGNSPREYTTEAVTGKMIITTTTNGTRALRACAGARQVFVGSFLNLTSTLKHLRTDSPTRLVIVCGGTYEEAALEDVLAAGAITNELWDLYGTGAEDSAQLARHLFLSMGDDLEEAMRYARNGRRLLSLPDLAADVRYCVQRDVYSLVAGVSAEDGAVSIVG
ncbi:MAG: 2-phosphosulfolactate phosphatase [Verrucomicrobiales bacterium]|nr:2-phosphosulfolactate phosphatase [Verrucomicrobiales bacterium]